MLQYFQPFQASGNRLQMPKYQILSIHLTSQVDQFEHTLQPRQNGIIILILPDESGDSLHNITPQYNLHYPFLMGRTAEILEDIADLRLDGYVVLEEHLLQLLDEVGVGKDVGNLRGSACRDVGYYPAGLSSEYLLLVVQQPAQELYTPGLEDLLCL